MEVISGKVQKAKKVVLYGPEGVGKSSLAARFPRPIWSDPEDSTKEMDVNRLKKPTSWQMLIQQAQWVKQQGSRFETYVVDTIDWAEMLCNDSICSQHGKKGIEDFGYGKGYVFSSEEFGRFLNLLSDLVEDGINVVLIAHSQIVKFEQPDEMGAYDRYQLKLGQKTGSRTAALVKEWADMVLFINYKTFSVSVDKEGKKNKAQGGVRTVYATHHPAWDAKNRHGLPDEFPLDYAHIAHIFTGPAVAAPTQTPTTSTPPVNQRQEQQVAPAPTQAPSPQTPQQQAAPAQTSEPNPNISKALRDLMVAHQVQEWEIQLVVGQKRYFPGDMPVADYPADFVNGVLVAAWPKVFEMIQDTRSKIPFE